MKTKRFLIFTAAIALAVIVVGYLSVIKNSQSGHLDATKIIAAIQAYSSKMKSENQLLPSTIALQELIAGGFLKHEDVSAFDGWKVIVSMNASDTINPAFVLMSAQSPDGHREVVLADGSVQSVK